MIYNTSFSVSVSIDALHLKTIINMLQIYQKSTNIKLKFIETRIKDVLYLE